MKSHEYEILDLVSIMSFLGQFKGACDSCRVPERVAILLLSFFMTTSTAMLLAIRMIPRKDTPDNMKIDRRVEGQEHIHACAEAVNDLLNSFATDDTVTNAAAEIEAFEEHSNQAAVNFAEKLKDKVLRRGGSIFVERMHLSVAITSVYIVQRGCQCASVSKCRTWTCLCNWVVVRFHRQQKKCRREVLEEVVLEIVNKIRAENDFVLSATGYTS